MILGKVTGTVVSTAKHTAYLGQKLLSVMQLDELGKPTGREFLAIDQAQAGVGDTVLVLAEGNGVRQILKREGLEGPPILETIVGVVDEIDVPEAE